MVRLWRANEVHPPPKLLREQQSEQKGGSTCLTKYSTFGTQFSAQIKYRGRNIIWEGGYLNPISNKPLGFKKTSAIKRSWEIDFMPNFKLKKRRKRRLDRMGHILCAPVQSPDSGEKKKHDTTLLDRFSCKCGVTSTQGGALNAQTSTKSDGRRGHGRDGATKKGGQWNRSLQTPGKADFGRR